MQQNHFLCMTFLSLFLKPNIRLCRPNVQTTPQFCMRINARFPNLIQVTSCICLGTRQIWCLWNADVTLSECVCVHMTMSLMVSGWHVTHGFVFIRTTSGHAPSSTMASFSPEICWELLCNNTGQDLSGSEPSHCHHPLLWWKTLSTIPFSAALIYVATTRFSIPRSELSLLAVLPALPLYFLSVSLLNFTLSSLLLICGA